MFRFLLLILGGGDNMVDAYVALIMAGRRTFAQVMPKYQADVHADLFALGLDDYGYPLQTP